MNPSRLDPRIGVTPYDWGVTLISARGCSQKRSGSGLPAQHAMIVIEGTWIDKNEDISKKYKYFATMIHLTGGTWSSHAVSSLEPKKSRFGVAEVKNWTEGTINYGVKTKTWLRPRESVQRMIDSTATEHVLAEENRGNPTPYSLFGDTSVLTRNYKEPVPIHPELRALQESDPVSFDTMYNIAIQGSRYDTYDQSVLGECVSIGTGIASFVAYLFNRNASQNMLDTYYRRKEDEIGKTYTDLIRVGTPQFDERKRECERLLQLMREQVEVKELPADNCFTWARRKLKMVDIDIGDKKFDKFIAVTTLHIQQEN